jgi:cytochrome c biogenesis protein CcmG/thiol:disulfide interchange protein DsbE
MAEIKGVMLYPPPDASGTAIGGYNDYRVLGFRLKRTLNTVLVVAFIVGMIAVFAYPNYREGEPSLRGRPAKDFSFSLDGKPARLSDFRGKIVVLNFWATWCPPCVEETPALNKLQVALSPLGGTILGVSLDDDAKTYDDFLKAFTVGFPTYRDPGKRIAPTYGTTMYPETYIIDPKGRIDRKIIGPQDWTSPTMLDYFKSLAAGQ